MPRMQRRNRCRGWEWSFAVPVPRFRGGLLAQGGDGKKGSKKPGKATPWRNAKQDNLIYEARKTRKLSYLELAREFFGDDSATRKAAKAIDSHRQKLRRQGRK